MTPPSHTTTPSVTAIVPTIGRAESLDRLLASLSRQSAPLSELVVADADPTTATRETLQAWLLRGLPFKLVHLPVSVANAAGQRNTAAARACGDFLLFLDDDVELEPGCLRQLLRPMIENPSVVATMADFTNQDWPTPTRPWKFYLRFIHCRRIDQLQGKVVGPLLRFGYFTPPESPAPVDWIGAGNSLVRASAFQRVGGFSRHFLERSTLHEDVDLGLRLARVGHLLFCPAARLAHHHAPGGRLSPAETAADDLHNRALVLHRTVGLSKSRVALRLASFLAVETLSAASRLVLPGGAASLTAKLSGWSRAIRGLLGSPSTRPSHA